MISSVGSPLTSIVSPGTVMLDVGFNAILATISCPLEIPPKMPPEWLERKPCGVSGSRCWLPFWRTTSKPSPISTPFTALMLIKAWAISASKRSNTGSPKPTGTPVATTWILAPIESPSFFSSRISSSNAATLSTSGQKKSLFSISFQSTLSIATSPICDK
ncbi:Uncharacterised protein [Vibrio cholerae]|nr:Uncharacterised protein [Vibrio cholerae]